MKKILFVCSAGMSTSLLVMKTEKAAAKRGIELDIKAMSEAEAKNNIDDSNVILLGPQVRFLLSNVKKSVGDKNIAVDVIDVTKYGRMDGEAVLDQILSLIRE